MEIYFDNRQDQTIDEEIKNNIEKAIYYSVLEEGLSDNFECSVSFVSKDEIKILNKEYRDNDSVTDVLSFPIDSEEWFDDEINVLGDIVLCIDRAKEQAIEVGNTFLQEMTYLTIHSTFHLLGYDHMEAEEKKEMRAMEKKVVAKFGDIREEQS